MSITLEIWSSKLTHDTNIEHWVIIFTNQWVNKYCNVSYLRWLESLDYFLSRKYLHSYVLVLNPPWDLGFIFLLTYSMTNNKLTVDSAHKIEKVKGRGCTIGRHPRTSAIDLNCSVLNRNSITLHLVVYGGVSLISPSAGAGHPSNNGNWRAWVAVGRAVGSYLVTSIIIVIIYNTPWDGYIGGSW